MTQRRENIHQHNINPKNKSYKTPSKASLQTAPFKQATLKELVVYQNSSDAFPWQQRPR